MIDEDLMQIALIEAERASLSGEVPIGAVICGPQGFQFSIANSVGMKNNALAHAEMLALQEAFHHRQDWRLNDYLLAVTLEPCMMCLGALFRARVGKLIVGCRDEKRISSSLISSLYILNDGMNSFELTHDNHTMEIHLNVLQEKSQSLLREFFQNRRRQ